MQFTSKFFNIHSQQDEDRTYILTNEVQVTPLMQLCLDNFFLQLNPDCQAHDIRITRQAPSKDGCRYNIAFTYINPKTRKPKRNTHKYTVNPITKELYFV